MIDVVIPCLNEAQYIEKNIQSILDQSYRNFNLYVVDGGSEDGTTEIVRLYEKKDARVHLLQNPHKTTPFALNIGIKEGNGEYVVIFGGHAVMDQNYLQKCIDCLSEKEEVACVGGLIESKYLDENSKYIGAAMSSKVGVGNVTFRVGGAPRYVDTVAFGAYRKKVFDEIGFFDEQLTRNQDDELNFRITRSGYKIYFDPEIKSEYFVRGTFKKLWRQYLQYGYWKVFVNKKHKSFLSVRQIVPPLFVAYVFAFFVLALLYDYIAIFYSSSLLIYSLILLVQSVKLAGANFYKVLFSFLILHFSYGLGYIKGILDFFVLGKSINKKMENITR